MSHTYPNNKAFFHLSPLPYILLRLLLILLLFLLVVFHILISIFSCHRNPCDSLIGMWPWVDKSCWSTWRVLRFPFIPPLVCHYGMGFFFSLSLFFSLLLSPDLSKFLLTRFFSNTQRSQPLYRLLGCSLFLVR